MKATVNKESITVCVIKKWEPWQLCKNSKHVCRQSIYTGKKARRFMEPPKFTTAGSDI
jgi:hypothetical protein